MIWTIRRKLLAMSLLAITFLVGRRWDRYLGSRQGDAPPPTGSATSSAIVDKQYDGMRAEYGVRGDVFEAIEVTTGAEVKATITEFKDFAAEWQSAQATVAAANLPAKLRPTAASLAAETEKVLVLGSNATNEAQFNASKAIALAHTFDLAFDKLDVQLNAFQVQLNAAEATTRKSADIRQLARAGRPDRRHGTGGRRDVPAGHADQPLDHPADQPLRCRPRAAGEA